MKKVFFAIIGILMVFLFIYLNNYSFVRTFDISGFTFNDDGITDNLVNGNKSKKVTYSHVGVSDKLYSAHGNYYIGEVKKKKINKGYPIVSKDSSQVLIVKDIGNMVDSKYHKVTTVGNTIVSRKYLYNEADYERSDNSVYLFIELDNSIYVNLDEIKIMDDGSNYKIPTNSFIYFSLNSLRYYYLNNGKYLYKEIGGLDHNSIVTINGKEISYNKLLIRLGLSQKEDKKKNIFTIINPKPKPETKVPIVKNQNNNVKKIDASLDYVKPTVKLDKFKGNTYSVSANLDINDPTNQISKIPTLEFYIGNNLYIRKSFANDGKIEISGLKPNENYRIHAYFEYKNEKGQTVRNNIGDFNINTLGIDNLESLELTAGNIKSYSNYADITNMKFLNKDTDEVLKGLKRIDVIVGDSTYQMSSNLVKSLANGKVINYTTPKSLKSNTSYNIKFVAYDLAGNKLKLNSPNISFKTLKEKPIVTFTLVDKNIDKATIKFNINNKDDVSIKNIHYVLFNSNKEQIRDGIIEGSKIVKFDNLDANEVYTVMLYGNYDLEDGNGIQKDINLCEGKFTTDSISSLGYPRIKLENSGITSNSASYKVTFDSKSTNSKLASLISSLNISVKDSATNSEVSSFIISGDDLKSFLAGNIYDLMIDGLESNHNYYFDIVTYVSLGSKKYDLKTLFNIDNFTTLKLDANIQIINKFTTEKLIDFDVRVNDVDGAIQSKRVFLEVRNSSGKLVYIDELKINSEYKRITIDKLDKNSVYSFKYIAEEYNVGFNNSTFVDNKIIYSENITTTVGLYGTVEIDSLLKQITSRNLFNINNSRRWKSSGDSDKPRREKTDDDTFTLGAKNGYRTYFYYLPEYVGKEVTVSFQAKYKNKNNKSAYFSNSSSNNCDSYHLDGLNSDEYKDFTFTFKMNSPYIAFTIREEAGKNNITYLELKDLQVEVGKKKTSYQKYHDKKNYNATIITNINDSKNEITDDDYNYYLRYYKDNKLVDTVAFAMDKSGKVVDAKSEHEIEPSSSYRIVLSVRIRGRFYDLNNVEFTSEDEIRTIHNVKEFLGIHTSGIYLVSNDLDFTDVTSNVSEFDGTIDFQGHKIIRPLFRSNNNNGTVSSMIWNVKSRAVLKNMDIHYYYNKNIAHGDFYGIARYNYGTISNLKITLEESYKVSNITNSFIAWDNYGIVENFAINLSKPLYGARSVTAGVGNNYGTMRNGYLYGEPIDGSDLENTSLSDKRLGGFATYAGSNSYVSNVFTTVPVVIGSNDTNSSYQNEVGTMFPNVNRTVIRNAYSYTSSNKVKTNRLLTHDANIWSGTVNAKKLYYADDEFYSGNYSNRISKIALRDEKFQDDVLNSMGAFNTKDFVKYGYYPQLNWPSVMPKQDYLDLPKVSDDDLIDVLNVENVEDGDEEAKVTISLNNPGEDKITDISIENLTTKIISQTTNKGKTELVFRAYNPTKYVSKYSLRKISYVNNANYSGSREFSDKERIIDFDLYRKVNSIDDFNKIVDRPTENYRLYSDLDFNNKKINPISGFKGKIDGNNHTIKNIRIESGVPLFNQLIGGTIKNLYVDNYMFLSYYSFAGLFGDVNGSAEIDNVHANKVTIYGSGRIGGLVSRTEGSTILNSSVSNVKVYVNNENHKTYEARVGGFIGENNNSIIENSFVRNLDMDVTQAFATYGIGGFVGRNNSGYIYNCYAEGLLNTNAMEVGGIVGYNSGNISRVISAVDVYTQQDSLGGVAGYSTNDYITNTLVVGDVFSNKENVNQGRTIGNRAAINSNYAWSNQLINGIVSNASNGDILITSEELQYALNYQSLIQLSDEFNYNKLVDSKGHNILPKLTYKDEDKLLPNQDDIEFYSKDFKVDEINVNKNINNATISITINNPENLKIKNIKINDMEISKVNKNVNLDGKTIYEVVAKPIHYYDSYLIDEVTYEDTKGKSHKSSFGAKVDVSFFKDISKYEDWQNISTDVFENYRLISDIDFAGKTNVKTNVNFNRLEGTDGGHTLSNIDVNFHEAGQSLIDTISSNISGITFSNITIKNTGSGNFSGIINYLNGNMNNVNFNKVTVDSPNISTSGMIALNMSQDIRNVNINDVNVSGWSNVGGFIGKTRYFDITFCNISNANIEGRGYYIGGFIGFSDWIYDPVVFYINGDNVHVNAPKAYYVGGLFGLASGDYCTLRNSEVTGYRYVGGMYGQTYSRNTRKPIVRGTTVSASSYDIGGIAGYSESVFDAYFVDGKVYGTSENANNVGGIVGAGGYAVYNSAVYNSIIDSLGDVVGGIKGLLSYANVHASGVYDTSVKGRNKVGGIVGTHQSTSNYIQYCNSNANVVATESYAGGIIGYVDNIYTTNVTNKIYIIYNLVEGGSVTASNYAGGLIGYARKMLFPGHMYSNYIDTSVNSNDGGYIVGGNDGYADRIDNLAVYSGMTLNNNIVNTDLLPSNVLSYNYDEIRVRDNYSKIGINSYFTFDKLSEGKYPSVDANYPDGRLYSNMTGTYNNQSKAKRSLKVSKPNYLPDVKVYVVDSDKINVEFSRVDDSVQFSINNNTNSIKELVYTYTYNFKDDFTIKLSDGISTKKITIKADDLRNLIYVDKNKYYYLNGNKVITNDSENNTKKTSIMKDKFDILKLSNDGIYPVNIYNNRILYSDGSIYDISNKKTSKNNIYNFKSTDLLPMYEFSYSGNDVDTYYNYSTISGKYLSKQLFVKDGVIDAVDSSLDNIKNNIFIDNYNNKNYLIYLGNDSSLHSLKDNIKFPSGFRNSNIKSFASDMYNSSDIIFVLYKNNNYVVFNYKTGKIIAEDKSNRENVFDYFYNTISSASTNNIFETKYKNSRSLEDKLNTKSISEVLNDNDSNSVSRDVYASIYNPVTNDYEVYELPSNDSMVQGNISERLNSSSTTYIIKNNSILNNYYFGHEKKNKVVILSVSIIMSSIIGLILILLFIIKRVSKSKYFDDEII